MRFGTTRQPMATPCCDLWKRSSQSSLVDRSLILEADWLAAAVSMAYCEQQGVPSGRVMLDVPILRDYLDRVNGFGFGVGSLLLPVKVNLDAPLTSVAPLVAARLKEMINQRWDENFEGFLGRNPSRHLRFAALRARGLHPPVITVSWKGAHWGWGAEDGIRDAACFAV